MFGWWFFIITMIPVIGIVQVGSQGMADRYMYIPSIGIILIISYTIGKYMEKNHINTYYIIIMSIMLVTLIIVAKYDILYWKNTRTLFERNIAVVGENVVNQYVLYTYENALGNVVAAAKHYDKAVIINKNIVAKMHNKRGYMYAKKKDYSIAEQELFKAIKLVPSYAPALFNLGIIMSERGQYKEAEKYLSSAMKIDSKYNIVLDDVKKKQNKEGK
jgi:tetratricopeptide (TPR) repeat protein